MRLSPVDDAGGCEIYQKRPFAGAMVSAAAPALPA